MIDAQEAVQELLLRIGHEIEAEAKEIAPKVEGDLARDIQVFIDNLDNLEISIGNSKLIEYAPFVHGGTGLYGPKKKRITPRTKKALKTPFGPRKSIAGMKANPYMFNALDNFLSSGKLDIIYEEFSDRLGDDIFNAVRNTLKNLRVDVT